MDIIGRIDSTLEAWERGPDAMSWTSGSEQGHSDGPVVVAHLRGEAFVAELTSDVISGHRIPITVPEGFLTGWEPIGTTTGTITLPEPPPAPEWLHMASCGYCDRTAESEISARVFFDQDARREWVDAHQEETGHAIWSLTSIRRDAITFEH